MIDASSKLILGVQALRTAFFFDTLLRMAHCDRMVSAGLTGRARIHNGLGNTWSIIEHGLYQPEETQ